MQNETNYNHTMTMEPNEIIRTLNCNVEYAIAKQVPEDVLRRVLQREEQTLIAENEIFVQYPDWEGYYCSNYGRLISTKGKEPKFIKQLPLTKVYKGYTLSDPNKEPLTLTTGRMVADIFCLNFYRDKGRDFVDVHHIDHNPENNCWLNLALLPESLHTGAVHKCDKKYGVKDFLEICVSPSVDGELPVNK